MSAPRTDPASSAPAPSVPTWATWPVGPVGVVLRAAVAGGLLAFFVAQSFYPHAADFKTFYSAGYAILHPEIPLYDLIALDENPFGEVFKLPPSAAVYLAPLSLLDLQEARLAWRIVLVAAFGAAYALLLRELRVPPLSWPWLAGLAGWVVFGPAQIAVGEGQWDPVFLVLLVVAAIGARRSRLVTSGLALALAASIKPYPLIVAGFFVARRWWRALAACLVGLTVLVGLGALVAGAEETAAFVLRALPASGASTPYADNQALGGVLARLAVNDFQPLPVEGTAWVDAAVRLAALGALAAAIWVVGRRAADTPDERAMQLALFVPLSILLLPAAWTHYATILLLPLTLVAAELSRARSTPWLAWGVLLAAFALLAIPNPTMLYGADLDRALWLRGRADAANLTLQRAYPTELARLVFSYKALGALLVLGLVGWRVARSGAPATADRCARVSELPAGATGELPAGAAPELARTATGVGS